MDVYSEDTHRKLQGLPHIFWINLERSPDRRKYMETLLNRYSLSNTRVEACDGSKYETFATISNVSPGNINKSELGCFCSHLKALEWFLQSDLENCLIAEDDLSFEFTSYWPKTFREYMNEIPADCQILQLAQTVLTKTSPESTTIKAHKPHTYGAVIYLVRRSGAKQLLEKIQKTVDNKYSIEKYTYLADTFLYSIAGVYSIALFSTYNIFRSTIHPKNVGIFNIPSTEVITKEWIAAAAVAAVKGV